MVCDRGRSYDAVELEGVAQQKCLAHLIRNAAKVVEDKTGRACHFGSQVIDMLRQSLSLSARRTAMRPKDYRQQAVALDDKLAWLLRDRTLRIPTISACSTEWERNMIAAGCCVFSPSMMWNPPTTAPNGTCDRP